MNWGHLGLATVSSKVDELWHAYCLLAVLMHGMTHYTCRPIWVNKLHTHPSSTRSGLGRAGIAWLPISSRFKISSTSSTVVSFKTESGSRIKRSMITGAGEAAFDAQIESIFFKNYSRHLIKKTPNQYN